MTYVKFIKCSRTTLVYSLFWHNESQSEETKIATTQAGIATEMLTKSIISIMADVIANFDFPSISTPFSRERTYALFVCSLPLFLLPLSQYARFLPPLLQFRPKCRLCEKVVNRRYFRNWGFSDIQN